jgi:hypothetical protein
MTQTLETLLLEELSEKVSLFGEEMASMIF